MKISGGCAIELTYQAPWGHDWWAIRHDHTNILQANVTSQSQRTPTLMAHHDTT